MLSEASSHYLAELIRNVLEPQKRLFFGYLFSAALIALLWGMLDTKGSWRAGLKNATGKLFAGKIWWSRSARADYKLLAANQATLMAAAPWLLSRVSITTGLYLLLLDWFGTVPALLTSTPVWVVVAAFTLTQFILDDASKYVLHRALHRINFLWEFHRVHHSAQNLTPFTVLRSHPVEGVLFSLRATLTQALCVATFVYAFGNKVSLLSIFGAQVFLFAFNALGSNLRHSHIPLRYGQALEHWLISPAQHQIHHSIARRHYDRNFGAVLAVWDRLGKTLSCSERGQQLTFGLRDSRGLESHRLLELYFLPLRDCLFVLYAQSVPIGRRHLMNLYSMAQRIRRLIVNPRTASLALVLAVSPAPAPAADALNIYSHRQPFLINPFLDAFRDVTGIETNVVFASKGLAQRLQAEGERSPADVVLTVDIGRLYVYADKNLLVPIESETLTANVPAHLRDADNRWFAFSTRARVIAYSKSRVDPAEITRIEDLAEPAWRGRVCSRPGSHVYNRALLASIIAANGEAAAESWARGLVENLAQRPQGNDRAQIKAIFRGVCDVALVNSYYFGKIKHSEIAEQREWVEDIGILFTNQDDRGNHINISGGGVAKHSKNKQTAIRFLEFLTTEVAQDLYGSVNYEFPVNPAVPASEEVRSWGSFESDHLLISEIATLAPTAQKIIDRVGW